MCVAIVTGGYKTPPDLCRIRPTKGRAIEGTVYGRADQTLPDRGMRRMIPKGAMIREHEAGEKTADVRPRHGISSATFYKCKSEYGGMEPSNAKR